MTHTLSDDSVRPATRTRPGRPSQLPATGAGRIGYVSPAGLQIKPVCFWRDSGRLFVQTTPDSSLEQLADLGATLTLEVDDYGHDAPEEWTISLSGSLVTADGPGVHDREPVHVHQHGPVCLEFVPTSA